MSDVFSEHFKRWRTEPDAETVMTLPDGTILPVHIYESDDKYFDLSYDKNGQAVVTPKCDT